MGIENSITSNNSSIINTLTRHQKPAKNGSIYFSELIQLYTSQQEENNSIINTERLFRSAKKYIVNLKFTAMKKTISALLVWLCITAMCAPANSQGYLEYQFMDIAVTMSYPNGWEVSREHVLLLLMPKNKQITLELEVLGEDLGEIIRTTMDNIIREYPNDTNIITKELKVNGLSVTEITLKTMDAYIVNYFIIVTPKNKVLKMYLAAPEEEILKHKNDLKYIKEHFSPIK